MDNSNAASISSVGTGPPVLLLAKHKPASAGLSAFCEVPPADPAWKELPRRSRRADFAIGNDNPCPLVSAFSSWRQTTSGFVAFSQARRFANRLFTLLMLKVTTFATLSGVKLLRSSYGVLDPIQHRIPNASLAPVHGL